MSKKKLILFKKLYVALKRIKMKLVKFLGFVELIGYPLIGLEFVFKLKQLTVFHQSDCSK